MDNGASSYRRFLEGDEAAFEALMQELFYGLVLFINGFVQDTHIAEDIAIDVFADLIVHKHRYNFKVRLKTYLYMMGRSRALDHIRRCKRIAFTPLSEVETLPDESASLEETVLADQRKRQLHAAIARLPEDMRVAVHLIYFAELSYEEAAKVMKKNRKQVDNLLYRAKRELRIILGEDGELLL